MDDNNRSNALFFLDFVENSDERGSDRGKHHSVLNNPPQGYQRFLTFGGGNPWHESNNTVLAIYINIF